MPAIISGLVFNDVNSSGTYNAGEPGIANAYVVLQDTTGNCTNVQTDSTGAYSFTNITVAGTYTIYETVTTPNACPPTTFTQPTGFKDSTTARKISVTVTAGNISGNTNLSGNNFGHDNVTAFGCQSFAWQVAVPSTQTSSNLNRIDLATGSTTNTGSVNPANSINSIGYNSKDGNLYGWNASTSRVCRVTPNRNVLDFPAIANLPASNTGDVDANGYLYLYVANGAAFYVVDVDPNRSTFLKLVSPSNSFQEITSAPFGTNLSSVINSGDWSFNPQDNQLYAIDNTAFVAKRIDPITGVVTNLTRTGTITAGSSFGGTFFDNHNNLYGLDNTLGTIYKFAISGNNVATSVQSSGNPSSSNDGARCPTAPINFASLSSTKTATTAVGVGDTITYTIVLNNQGNTTANNVVIIDTLPNGTIFDANSLRVDNNAPISGDPNPPTGINIGSLGVGVHTVIFTATATTIPSPNPTPNVASGNFQFVDGTYPDVLTDGFNTNVASTTINYAIIASTKSSNIQYADVGYTINYTVALKNNGIVTASNIVFIDTIPNATSLVTNSLKQGTTTVTGSPNPPGVTLPSSIGPGQTSTVTFSVVVLTIPSANPIPNTASATYSYTGNPSIPTTKFGNTNSNVVNVAFSQANLGGIKKSVDLNYATCNQILTYTITIPNTGNTTAFNVILRDTIPNGTSLVSNSVTINSVTQPAGTNPQTGVTVGTIPVGAIATVTFQVKVNC